MRCLRFMNIFKKKMLESLEIIIFRRWFKGITIINMTCKFMLIIIMKVCDEKNFRIRIVKKSATLMTESELLRRMPVHNCTAAAISIC